MHVYYSILYVPVFIYKVSGLLKTMETSLAAESGCNKEGDPHNNNVTKSKCIYKS